MKIPFKGEAPLLLASKKFKDPLPRRLLIKALNTPGLHSSLLREGEGLEQGGNFSTHSWMTIDLIWCHKLLRTSP